MKSLDLVDGLARDFLRYSLRDNWLTMNSSSDIISTREYLDNASRAAARLEIYTSA